MPKNWAALSSKRRVAIANSKFKRAFFVAHALIRKVFARCAASRSMTPNFTRTRTFRYRINDTKFHKNWNVQISFFVFAHRFLLSLRTFASSRLLHGSWLHFDRCYIIIIIFIIMKLDPADEKNIVFWCIRSPIQFMRCCLSRLIVFAH